MNTKPAALIHAFRHPLLISSIVVLLINDHLLKVYSPSWLTGKLSDFAGLFFFPFLLALVLIRLIRDEGRSLRWGLLLTGAVFTAIKTLPAANAAATWLVSQALGQNARFALDPTDLIALIMLPAAWLFWKKMRADSGTNARARLAYAVMALGALSALASTPCAPPPEVTRLVVQEGQVYAVEGYYYNSDNGSFYTLSEDGQTWNLVKQLPDSVSTAFKTPAPKMPITHCDPAEPQVCYRVNGQANIEQSRDGGQTWQTTWQYPPGRETYQERVGMDGYCMGKPDQRFYDLAILSRPGGSIVVAAAGNQGVLIRRPDQAWQRMGLGGMKPAPLQSGSLQHAFKVVDYEFILAGAASLLAYTILSILARYYIQAGTDGKRSYPAWALHPAWFAVAWVPTLLALYLGAPNGMLTPTVQSYAVSALLIMLAVLLLSAITEKGRQRKTGLLAFLAVLVVLALPVSFFMLWALGVIVYYSAARTIALAVTLPIFAGLFYLIWRELSVDSGDD